MEMNNKFENKWNKLFFERVLKKKNEMGSLQTMNKRNFKKAERALFYSNLNLYFWSHKSKNLKLQST